MSNQNNCEEKITNCGRTSSGLLIAVVLYILLVIILSSFRTYY